MENKHRALGKNLKIIISAVIIVLLFGAVVILGNALGTKQYYLLSFIIIAATIGMFFLAFEKRKPKPREIVMVAVMCAIAVASRTAFIWLPHFKPFTAVIIIAGIALGAECGFLTGAVAAFVSNFIFGQGPWTPWQMLAFGLAGYIAGILFSKGLLSKNRVMLAIFGSIIVLVIVGPVLDTSTLVTAVSNINFESTLAVYLSGFPINLIHAAATALTLFLISPAFFQKIDRVKIKYGIMS